MTDTYRVKPLENRLDAAVRVPGSKSVTNRALLMAALAPGRSVLRGVLFSDDSRHFLQCLISLGFEVEIDEPGATVTVMGHGGVIPEKEAKIDVGSAGTAARFLTALLGLSDGEYTINASEQMQARPMQSLFEALTELGARFEYLRKEGFLPVKVTGRYYKGKDRMVSKDSGRNTAHVDISKSTQYLSALMMTGVMVREGLDMVITSEKTTGSYVKITSAMMEDFGCRVEYDGHDYHISGGQAYRAGEYEIEPDISAACYFWAMAAVTGGRVLVEGVRREMMQGDMRFLEVLERMGCTVEEINAGRQGKDNDTKETEVSKGTGGICGVRVTAPESGRLLAVDVDMNDFSDQTMTLAAIAPFAQGTTYIRNVGHIRLQESDRIQGILMNLHAMGVDAGVVKSETDGKTKEGIYIRGGAVHGARIRTFEDHRMAMAFAVPGLLVEDIVIENPRCCGKTFENYFEVLEDLTRKSAKK